MTGWVYVMSNPAMPSLIKIGMSSKDPNIYRVRELSQETGVPAQFVVEYQALVQNERSAELHLHSAFKSYLFNKEFYKDLPVAKVIAEARRSLDILHDEFFHQSPEEIAKEETTRRADESAAKRKIARSKAAANLEIADAKAKEWDKRAERRKEEWREYIQTHEKQIQKQKKAILRMLNRPKWVPGPSTHREYDEYRAGLLGFASTGNGAFASSAGSNRVVRLYAGEMQGPYKPHGHGTMLWVETRTEYCGYWSNGKRDGLGTQKTVLGTISSGLWSAGDLKIKMD
jgi:hypothetical protein